MGVGVAGEGEDPEDDALDDPVWPEALPAPGVADPEDDALDDPLPGDVVAVLNFMYWPPLHATHALALPCQ